MGDSKKYPYPTMGCINILTLLPLEIPNCSIPMFSPNSKIVNPPSPSEFLIFFQTLWNSCLTA